MKYILAIIILLYSSTSFAKWKDIPLEDVVASSDLIVIATLTNVQRMEKENKIYCQGDLQVDEVLKGVQINSIAIKWVYSIPLKSISVDHSTHEGKSILWLLEKEEDESYSAHYYKRVQQVENRAQIQKIIETQSKQQ